MRHAAVLSSLPLALCLAAVAYAGDTFQEPAAGTEVAVMGKEHFSYAQLPDAVHADLESGEQRYQQRLHQLALDHQRDQQALLEKRVNSFLDNRLLQAEAARRHMTVTALIKDVKYPQITEVDVRAFYEQHRQQFNQPFEAEFLPISQYLVEQAVEQGKRTYLAGLRARYGARATLSPLRQEVSAGTAPSRGPGDSSVTLVEFADFQCPYCAKLEPGLQQLQHEFPQVRLVFRQLPLASVHPYALEAAEASLCAREQDKFWEMHDALFADQKALGPEDLKKTAQRLGLDPVAFQGCLDSARVAGMIQADERAGAEYGVDGTPGLFVNGRFVNGAVSYEQLAAIVQDELARQTAAHGPATAALRP